MTLMIFFAPEFPPYANAALEEQFTANIRTMAVGFNAVAHYPSKSYDGADPLAAVSPEKVREHVARMVQAIAGDEGSSADARAWFEDPDHLLYCSEFLHLSASAGLLCPLNSDTIAPLVGQDTWQRFSRLVVAHARGEETPFTTLNKNHRVGAILTTLAAEDLRPLPDHAPAPQREAEHRKLAFEPLTAEEIIKLSIAELTPPQYESQLRAAVHESPAKLLNSFSPDFLASLQTEARFAHGGSSTETPPLFVPPTILHFVAKGRRPGGLLSLRYLGHGINFSLLRTAS